MKKLLLAIALTFTVVASDVRPTPDYPRSDREAIIHNWTNKNQIPKVVADNIVNLAYAVEMNAKRNFLKDGIDLFAATREARIMGNYFCLLYTSPSPRDS